MTAQRLILARFGCLAHALGVVTMLATLPGISRSDELPRYKLNVGQELAYRLTIPTREANTDRGKVVTKYVLEWKLWVTRQNDNGTWRIVFVDQRTNSTDSPDREVSTHAGVSEGYFDLAPDGRMEETGIRAPGDPTLPFPPLPHDQQSLTTSWEATRLQDDLRRKVRLVDRVPQSGAWRLIEDAESPSFKAGWLTSRREYVFDNEQGLVRQGTLTETTSRHGQTAAPLELVSTSQLKADEIDSFRTETDRYFAARNAYHKLIDRATADLAHTSEYLDPAEAELKPLDGILKLPTVRLMLENKLKEVQATRERLASNVARFRPLLDKPSETWETTDLDGKRHSLEDYRGKVVVLDFWYRGCGPCVQSMPQIKQLAEDFVGPRVAILGMNSDRRDGDAKFVIDMLKLDYPTLRNGNRGDGIDSKYYITGYPTFIVIDARGVIRHVHVGLSFTLRHDLGEKIRELLAENA